MEDDDLEFGAKKNRTAKGGRRAKNPPALDAAPPEDISGDEAETIPATNTTEQNNVRTGRRARRQDADPPPTASTDVPDEETMTASDNTANGPSGGPPRPSRRVGGWGDDSSANRRQRRFQRRRPTEDQFEDERLRPTSPDKEEEDSDNDIPVIPDLEDQQEDDLTTQVAQAPSVAVNRVATYRELDNDLLKHAAFLTLDNEIDLKLLTRCLSAEADVQEEDKPWDWERIFTEVTSELLTEWEKTEAPSEEDKLST